MELLGQALIRKGYIDRKQLERALREQAETKELLGKIVRSYGVSAKNVSKAIAEANELEYIDLEPYLKNPKDPDSLQKAVNMIDRDMVYKFKLFPFELQTKETGRVIRVAFEDPFDIDAIDILKRKTGKDVRIEIWVSDLDSITKAVSLYYGTENELDEKISNILGNLSRNYVSSADTGGTEITELLDLIIEKAVLMNATDIHFSPEKKITQINFRLDGILYHQESIARQWHDSLVNMIKIESRLNIAEKRVPQDGNMFKNVGGQIIDIRTSVAPCDYGENVVLRLLYKSNVILGLEHLGLTGQNITVVNRLTRLSHGIVLVSGPTGHGKTTTLYSMLKMIDAEAKNILTIEDPIEYRLDQIKQTQVNEKAGLTFARAIRHFLRQDPDVILVGEIRDLETAKIAFQAAMTGHLVFSTIHANDSVACFARLLDLGVEPYLLDIIKAVISERLVRKICPSCKDSYVPSPVELSLFDLKAENGNKFYMGKGCQECRNTGYKGRTGIFEILLMSAKISNLIVKKESLEILREEAIAEGFQTLREDGLEKAKKGLTTLEEVSRVS